jgi:hypothetical protein
VYVFVKCPAKNAGTMCTTAMKTITCGTNLGENNVRPVGVKPPFYGLGLGGEATTFSTAEVPARASSPGQVSLLGKDQPTVCRIHQHAAVSGENFRNLGEIF